MYFDEERPATPAEAMREEAMNVGFENPERPWILTDYDVWIANPYYKGPPVPHPDDAYYMTEEEAKAFAEDASRPLPKVEPKTLPSRSDTHSTNDEIPF